MLQVYRELLHFHRELEQIHLELAQNVRAWLRSVWVAAASFFAVVGVRREVLRSYQARVHNILVTAAEKFAVLHSRWVLLHIGRDVLHSDLVLLHYYRDLLQLATEGFPSWEPLRGPKSQRQCFLLSLRRRVDKASDIRIR